MPEFVDGPNSPLFSAVPLEGNAALDRLGARVSEEMARSGSVAPRGNRVCRGIPSLSARPIVVAFLLLCLAGCYRSVVKGTVVDLAGEALPGVAVSVNGTDFQSLSNALGEYSVRYNPGSVQLHFDKTGYTPAVLNVHADGVFGVKAQPVTLWHLPQNRGVFFFENGRYTATEPVEPARYAGPLFGTEKWPSTVTTDNRPRLITYHLPAQGVSLVKLQFVEAVPEGTVTQEPEEVWVSAATVPIEAMPIDRPQQLLVELHYQGDLEPGTYAVQWGALQGSPEPVPSIYLFSVESEAGPAEAAIEDKPEEPAPEEKKAEEEKPEKPKEEKKPE
ncbi:MAG: carboxypeptidase-like regulatory domain-containing protein [FCB group bacterium]|nr:carboxypeptidase-like regulatory domain-containing protein [FCB group bacterium]